MPKANPLGLPKRTPIWPKRHRKTGALIPIKGLRGVRELPKNPRVFTKTSILPEVSGGREPVEIDRFIQAFPLDLENRAVQGEPGSVLERIVKKRLLFLLGEQGFIQQGQIQTGALLPHRLGRFVIDFVVTARYPALALEVQGAHWHRPINEADNIKREILIRGLGYDYAEILEYEILIGDDYLDERIKALIGRPTIIKTRVTEPGKPVPQVPRLTRKEREYNPTRVTTERRRGGTTYP